MKIPILVASPLAIDLCRSRSGFKRRLKRLNIPRDQWPEFIPEGSDACVHFLDSGGVVALVCFGNIRKRDLPQIVALLAHEAMHIWREIREIIGERDPSSEFEAYSVQSIVQHLVSQYMRSERKRKRKTRR